jgi:DNA-binding NarL/FixJ family response regulator
MTTGSYSPEAGRPLSPRMVEVLRLAARGATLEATAAELELAVSTVCTIRSAAFARLGVSSVTAAVVEASRIGAL